MYVVIEMQTNSGVVTTLTYQYNTLAEAYSKYYLVLSAAAVSSVDVHTAIILDSEGCVIEANNFKH